MQIKVISTFFIVIFCLMIMQTASVAGQKQKNNKVINKKGWKLQKIEDLEIKKEKNTEIDGIAVIEKTFQIEERKPYITWTKSFDCMFRNLTSYSINEKTFAFEGYCVPLVSSNNMQYYLGAIMRIIIFDEDGDGKFESKYNSLNMEIFVPDPFKQR